jgi:hypothetical protein
MSENNYNKYVKFLVGTKLWLVPEELATPAFRSAVEKLNQTGQGEAVNWTPEEYADFYKAWGHPALWSPF